MFVVDNLIKGKLGKGGIVKSSKKKSVCPVGFRDNFLLAILQSDNESGKENDGNGDGDVARKRKRRCSLQDRNKRLQNRLAKSSQNVDNSSDSDVGGSKSISNFMSSLRKKSRMSACVPSVKSNMGGTPGWSLCCELRTICQLFCLMYVYELLLCRGFTG